MLPIAILCGGFGSRLGMLTTNTPKILINVNNKPFIDRQLELLIRNGYKEFVYCVSHKSEMIREYLGEGKNWGVKINYSIDGSIQLGTGGAIKKAINLLGEKFAVIYGDSYLPINYQNVEKHFLNTKSLALITVFRNCNNFDMSNLVFQNGKIVSYGKNESRKNMNYIDYGLSYFNADVFSNFREKSTFDLSAVCMELIKNRKLDGYEVFQRFFEIGSMQGISEFSNYLRKGFDDL